MFYFLLKGFLSNHSMAFMLPFVNTLTSLNLEHYLILVVLSQLFFQQNQSIHLLMRKDIWTH